MSRRPWYIEFASPLLANHATAPENPSANSSPPSPTTKTTPITSPTQSQLLTPPPRLFDRPILSPHTPTSCFTPPSSIHSATPPPSPLPWIWRCHHCHSIYRLGVTRRCLEDGHMFCSVPTAISSVSPQTPSPSQDCFSSDTVKALDEERARRRREKRKRKRSVGCLSEFDYAGWEGWNLWRREFRTIQRSNINPDQHGTKKKSKSRYSYPLGSNKDDTDCHYDCDFPSECRQLRAAEADWEHRRARLIEGGLFELDACRSPPPVPGLGLIIPTLSSPFASSPVTSPSSEILAETERLERELCNVQLEAVEDSGWDASPGEFLVSEPTSPGGFSSDGEEEVMDIDIDGLGEGGDVEDTSNRVRGRRESLEEDPPSSPLKETWDGGIWDAGIQPSLPVGVDFEHIETRL